MPLEELIGQEEFNSLAGKPFGIDPGMGYDRKEFVTRAGDLFDVEEYYQRLSKNSGDVDALIDLANLANKFMAGDKERNRAMLQENPNLALEQANVLYTSGSNKMARFVGNKKEAVLDKLSAEHLYSLFSRIPLYKTEDKQHDRIRKLRDKVGEIQETAKKGGDVGSVVQEEVSEIIKKAPEEQKIFIIRNQHLAIPHLTNGVIASIQKAFGYLFRTTDEKLDKEGLKKYLARNYKAAEDFINGAPEQEREDYWSDNLKPQYVELARELYKSEKQEQKKEDNPEKEARKEKAREIGLAA